MSNEGESVLARNAAAEANDGSQLADWARPTLYLGYGGVLHVGAGAMDPHGRILLDSGRRPFEYADLLGEMLASFPSVQIVISCGWTETLGDIITKNLLPSTLRKRVVATTTALSAGLEHLEEGDRRALRILRHARAVRAKRWLAIDPRAVAIPTGYRKHFLVTREDEALGSIDTQQQLESWLDRNASDADKGDVDVQTQFPF
ncbi:HAD domain-containing protein [Paraburkholderia graminis]|uniref:HAD domain-containing protein n=1 Tax=Paraburkholderia graminis TaxID=60548 RepID=UPI00278CC10E|nr:HAD domain-containing protein [Paraburkholderia graminis]MDQ0627157.1 hypothetical protein [Paraburkholderia graminis]